jgi:general secretion pathway protein I
MKGFTLLEVLIALAILAIALAAAVRATSTATDNTTELKSRLLANWIAQDRLAGHIATRSFPSAGESEGVSEQAKLRFRWREDVSQTPNPAFRKIDIRVSPERDEDRVLAHVTGYLNPPVQRQ